MLSLSISVRLSLLMAALFSAGALLTPYFPLYLQSRGLSQAEIGQILGATTFTRLLIGPLGAMADRSGDRRPIFITYALIALIAGAALWFVSGFAAFLVTTLIAMTFWNPLMPTVEAVAAVHAARGAGDFGRMRAWGTTAFVVVTVAAGAFLTGRSPDWILILIGLTLVSALLLGFLMPPLHRTASSIPGQKRGYARLLALPDFLVIVIVAACIQCSHQMLYLFGSIHWKAIGFSDAWIGLFWSSSVLTETMLFAWSSRLRGMTPHRWMIIGAAAAIVRWAAFPYLDNRFAVMALQTLHALSFGATHIGMVQFIARRVSERQSVSAQSFYAMGSALVSGVVAFAVAPVFAAYGGWAFQIMVLPAAVGLIILLVSGAGRQRV